jgi:hypothetical protein
MRELDFRDHKESVMIPKQAPDSLLIELKSHFNLTTRWAEQAYNAIIDQYQDNGDGWVEVDLTPTADVVNEIVQDQPLTEEEGQEVYQWIVNYQYGD